jgi:hypothetical protein
MSIIIYLSEFQLPMCSLSRIFKFLKIDCGTIPVPEIISGIIIIIIILFYYHQTVLTNDVTEKYPELTYSFRAFRTNISLVYFGHLTF